MSITRKITYLLLAMLAIVLLPWLGSYIHHQGNFPEGFFAYPYLEPIPKKPFSWVVFGIFAVAFAGIALVYLFPKLAGFKKVPPPPKKERPKVKWPLWFWIGLLAWGSAIVLLWTKSMWPLWYLHWSDLPLFWGFTLVIDGIVYKRTGGKSIISQMPQEIIGIGLVSVGGWMIFEYLNFFVDDNWFYPRGDIIDREQFLLYAIVISSGLLPLAFEWYSLFKTIPAMRFRFSNGIKVVLPEWMKSTLLVLSIAGLFGAGLFPEYLFFSLWVTPAMLLALVLDKIGVWTPLTPIGKGNWSPTLLFALTYLVEGFFLEGQNYFSGTHAGGNVVFTEAPAYWQYSLPYVDAFHIFEMPLLGYSGYLPFGVYCWIWWISWAYMLNIPSRFYKEEPFEEQYNSIV